MESVGGVSCWNIMFSGTSGYIVFGGFAGVGGDIMFGTAGWFGAAG